MKPEPAATKAVLWDLDGTLVDSLPDLALAARRLGREEGLSEPSDDDVRRAVGDGVRLLILRLFPEGDANDLERRIERFLAHYLENPVVETRPFPGIPALLDALSAAGFRHAVVTNKPQALARDVVRELGLDARLPVVLGGGAEHPLKPAPDLPLAALARLGVAPAGARLVGDHSTDLGAGRAAGCSTVFCRWGYGRPGAETPDATASSVDELRAILLGAGD